MKWIAHRGYSEKAPENTFAAFRRAIDSGASGIEFDVHVSKDGELVVMHDEHVGRTTDGEGRIRDMSHSELATLDAGAWFSEQYRGEPVPTLEEVLDFVPSNMLLNIEIKNIPHVYPEIEKKVNQALVHRDREENTIVSSFDHACLYRLKEWNPAVNIGLLMNFRAVNLESYLRLFSPFAVRSIHPHAAVVQKNEVEHWLDDGLKVYPYGVNNAAVVDRMKKFGVSGVIADAPPGYLR